jgi:hypothetical protein
MILEPDPGLRIERRSLGNEGAPLLVIDRLVREPERLVRKAERLHFTPQGAMFPGIRARAPLSYEAFLERLIRPLLGEVFGLPVQARLTFPMCHYSLVTRPPEELAFLQRVPHIDSTTGKGLATVHYLFRGDWGGTAFYRHRGTGFEYVDEARREGYYRRLEQESQGADAPSSGYIGQDTALFERIDAVDGVFNRMVVYRRNSLHSGAIDNDRVPPPDPLNGRLSINTFIDVFP